MRLRRFGPYEIDLDGFELRRGGRRVALQRQPFALLVRLLETPGEIVSRAELRRLLWPEGTHVVFEHGLDAALHRLRQALDDPARASRFLETQPGLGVRFVAPVSRVNGETGFDLDRARWLRGRRTPRALEAAAALYQSACEDAASDPAPHAGLASTLVLLAEYGLRPAAPCWEEARRAALRALALDSCSAEASAALAAVLHRHDWRFAAAEAGYRTVIRRDPADAASRHGLAELLSQQGRHAAALAEIRAARAIEPVSPVLGAVEGWLLFHARRHDDAVACAREILALDAGFPIARLVLGRALLQSGRPAEALHHLRRAAEDAPDAACVLGALGYAEGLAGESAAARRRLQHLAGLTSSAYFRARILAALGDLSNAWSALALALRERSGWLADLGVDPEWDPWRGETGFQTLLGSLTAR